jgi:hypothetical protein
VTVLSARERAAAIALASRSAVSEGILTLRANGKTLAAPDVDTLLARAVARERVELELDVLAYEQGVRSADGARVHNRNHIRFRDGLMVRLGRTGTGTPFLRDHKQDDSSARGGTVLDSRTEKVDESGHYRVVQTVRLTEPSAVERALRGLTSAVSIGWRPTGPVHCTACKAEILTPQCRHFPGDVLEGRDEPVEWEFQDAELIETSEVPVPGVQSAGVEGIRAALAAQFGDAYAPRETIMVSLATIATKLGLAATAGETEVAAAVDAWAVERTALHEQLASAQRSIAETNARLAAHEAVLSKQAEDKFITDGITDGKITLGAHADAMRAYFRSNADGARAMVAAAPRITPVGLPSQLSQTVPGAPASPSTAVDQALSAVGVNPVKVRQFAGIFGSRNVEKDLSRIVEEV